LTVVLVTHDLGAMAQACTRAAVMYAGEIVESGSLEGLFHQPRHPYTKLLFDATPDIFGKGPLAWIPGSPPRLDLPIAGCPFRPRCPHAFAPCVDVHPDLIEVSDRHRAACHLNGVSSPSE
jgi:oligopeptide/dipeptide ABC transporter ATP-binding protein